ncbi:hypothetical protein AMTR_s00068p00126190 [Amborella trichopoda]|uniref:Uncharacterized protein n=1 Tax=Amborella trichopoda TaxID=13333 RepID=U5DD31_AMBTC|nr:hypothetical protein AMTR_s00068p00126190 [Amborella trichopoda]
MISDCLLPKFPSGDGLPGQWRQGGYMRQQDHDCMALQSLLDKLWPSFGHRQQYFGRSQLRLAARGHLATSGRTSAASNQKRSYKTIRWVLTPDD